MAKPDQIEWIITPESKRFPHLQKKFPKNAFIGTHSILPAQGQALAWHFSYNRKIPCVTLFYSDEEKIWVDKSPIQALTQTSFKGSKITLHWRALKHQPFLNSPEVIETLFQDSFSENLSHFLKNALTQFQTDQKGVLKSHSIDALFINAVKEKKQYDFFDLEWELDSPIPISWYVFRNFFALGRFRSQLMRSPPFKDLKSGFHEMCSKLNINPEWEENLARESELQSLATLNPNAEYHYVELQRWFQSPLKKLSIKKRIALLLKR